MSRQAALYHNRERNRDLNRGRRFASLVSSPFDLGTVAGGNPSPNPFSMPVAANIGISFSGTVTAGDISISASSRTLGTPDLAADEIHRLGFFEAGVSIIPTGANAGTVTLHYFDQWFRPSAIATGVFS
jgi:hypothetical protein